MATLAPPSAQHGNGLSGWLIESVVSSFRPDASSPEDAATWRRVCVACLGPLLAFISVMLN